MSTEQERTKILEMLAQGTISADEAVRLLEKSPEPTMEPAILLSEGEPEKSPSNGKQPRWLHVRVSDLNSGKDRVKVKIPFRLMRWGLKLGSKFTNELDGLDMDELINAMHEGGDGMLVDVRDEADGEHVQVFVE
ncbi:MAG: hypothetical protein KJ063_15795 [Anaerolineae bacterium]|nr:hypothetical protein [Anaerolineae bacterium]